MSSHSGPPPVPPKRNYKNRISGSSFNNTKEASSPHINNAIAGAGINVARHLPSSNHDLDEDLEDPNEILLKQLSKPKDPPVSKPQNKPKQPRKRVNDLFADRSWQDNPPDIVIGKDVEMTGALDFEGLLRIEGKFQGTFISQGDVIITSTGSMTGNISNIKRLWIDGGKVIGDIQVVQLIISGEALVQGNLSCKYFEIVGKSARIQGKANIHPNSPDPYQDPTTITPSSGDIPVGKSESKPHEELKKISEPISIQPLTNDQSPQQSPRPEPPITQPNSLEEGRKARKEAQEKRLEIKRQLEEQTKQSSPVKLSPRGSILVQETLNELKSTSPEKTKVQQPSPEKETHSSPKKKVLSGGIGEVEVHPSPVKQTPHELPTEEITEEAKVEIKDEVKEEVIEENDPQQVIPHQKEDIQETEQEKEDEIAEGEIIQPSDNLEIPSIEKVEDDSNLPEAELSSKWEVESTITDIQSSAPSPHKDITLDIVQEHLLGQQELDDLVNQPPEDASIQPSQLDETNLSMDQSMDSIQPQAQLLEIPEHTPLETNETTENIHEEPVEEQQIPQIPSEEPHQVDNSPDNNPEEEPVQETNEQEIVEKEKEPVEETIPTTNNDENPQ